MKHHNPRILILGLTGSIGMGKTILASQLESMGAKICNADAIVHKLLGFRGAAVDAVEKYFPGVVQNHTVDRKKLGDIVFRDKDKLKTLERILHPLVVAEENRFIESERQKGTKIIVLEIPLLYETGAEKRCDKVIVVSAPHFLQRQRVLKRSGMTEDKFHHILAMQVPDRKKRQRANAVILTGLGRGVSFRKLATVIRGWHA